MNDEQHRAMKFVRLAVILMLALYLVKMYSVYYYSSRGNSLGFPYDALTFNVPDRFTDWLVTIVAGNQTNPYHLPPTIKIPHMPYGFITFVFLKPASLLELHFYFAVCIVAFVALNFLLLKQRVADTMSSNILLFLALLAGFYPLYYEIDRGNVEIFSALALSGIYLCFVKRYPTRYTMLLLAVLVSLKPANLLFVLPILLFGSYRQIIASFALIVVNYVAPVYFASGSIYYMINEIRATAIGLHDSPLFCHSVACSLRALDLPELSILIAAIFGIMSLALLILARRRLDRASGLPLSIALITLTSLLSADPSFDYALTLLLPIFIYFAGLPIAHIDDGARLKSPGYLLAIGFAMATGFVNLYSPGVGDWYTVARCTGLLVMYFVFARYVLSLSSKGEPSQGRSSASIVAVASPT